MSAFVPATPPRISLQAHPIVDVMPEWLTHSQWIELTPLGMLLVDLIRPRTLVELGTQHGVSYCAFCQAVKALNLDAQCFAVDTWLGDEHTLYYGPDVLAEMRAYHDPRYREFSTLLAMTFDRAARRFAAESIDLLHIDGAHGYQAVRHDFTTWLPRMSRRGVMLFHDIEARHSGFGVRQFWAEVAARYPHFQVAFGHGLGVLAVGAEPPPALQPLLNLPPDQAIALEEQLAARGRRAATAQRAALSAAGVLPPTPPTGEAGGASLASAVHPERRRALVVNSGVNGFFEIEGRRVAAALNALGIQTDLAHLGSRPGGSYDWCFVNNPLEVAASTGDAAAGLSALKALGADCGQMFALTMEDATGPWYSPVREATAQAGIATSVDLGLEPQPALAAAEQSVRFLFNGLTQAEKQQARLAATQSTPRPLPWAMIGIQTPGRVRLVDALVRHVAPDGFVYLPTQDASKGKRLDETAMMHILTRAAYYIWTAQHNPLYWESQRFRQAVLSGSAPIKILPPGHQPRTDFPLACALVRQEDLPDPAALPPAAAHHRQVAAAYCALPSLEAGLAALLGLPAPAEVADAD